MSFDSIEDNAAFAAAEGFQYDLWSDVDRVLALYYGAATSADQAFASRKTYVLDEQGRLCLQYASVGVSTHPAEVLEDVTRLLEP